MAENNNIQIMEQYKDGRYYERKDGEKQTNSGVEKGWQGMVEEILGNKEKRKIWMRKLLSRIKEEKNDGKVRQSVKKE